MNKKICLLIIALEGGALLSFEIIASRLYTPYLGSALHVWTSILTMTLLALACGYYFGSRVRNELVPKTLLTALIVASAFILLSPVTADFILTQNCQFEPPCSKGSFSAPIFSSQNKLSRGALFGSVFKVRDSQYKPFLPY